MSGSRMPGDAGRAGDGRVGPACPRTAAVIERVIRDRVTPEDRGHAATCAACGPVLLRGARFDEELRAAARGLIAEELPRGILDPGLSGVPRVTSRGTAPGLAGIAAAVGITLIAVSVALLPGGAGDPSPGASGGASAADSPAASEPVGTPADTGIQMPPPPLRSTSGIGGSLLQNDWVCRSGGPRASAAPGSSQVDREGIVCASPKALVLTTSVLTTRETVGGEVVEVVVRGDLVVSTDSAVTELSETFSKAAYVSMGDTARAPAVGDWVLSRVADLQVQPSGDEEFAVFGDVLLTLRLEPEGGYLLRIEAQPR